MMVGEEENDFIVGLDGAQEQKGADKLPFTSLFRTHHRSFNQPFVQYSYVIGRVATDYRPHGLK